VNCERRRRCAPSLGQGQKRTDSQTQVFQSNWIARSISRRRHSLGGWSADCFQDVFAVERFDEAKKCERDVKRQAAWFLSTIETNLHNARRRLGIRVTDDDIVTATKVGPARLVLRVVAITCWCPRVVDLLELASVGSPAPLCARNYLPYHRGQQKELLIMIRGGCWQMLFQNLEVDDHACQLAVAMWQLPFEA
jgi:hypothetical protein